MKMSLIVFGALAASFFLRRRSAALRHWVLAAGVAGAATLPLLTAVVPAWPLPFATPTAFTAYQDPFESAVATTARPVGAGPAARAASSRAAQVAGTIHLGAMLQWMWIAGTLIALAILLTAWTDERARVVLSHELAHIRRGDWLVQLSAELLRAFYWFNPLVWVACRRLRLESEYACDDEVMRNGVEGTDYATHLIELARALNQRRAIWFPAPAMARPSSLERRVRAMLTKSHDRGSISARTRIVIVLSLLAATVAVAAAQSGFSTFRGSIADESTLGIPSTTVSLTNDARQAKYEVKTDALGRFEFVGLPPGDYGLEVKGMGFQSLRDAVTISGQNLQRSYTLKLGTLQETVNVVDDGREHVQSTIREVVPKTGPACVSGSAGGRIVPPKKIRDYAPVFPASLRGTGINAAVVMEGRITLDGFVTDIRIIGDAHPDLASAAVAAIREWRFTQTLLNCEPSDVLMTITVNFKTVPPPPPPPL